MSWIAAQKRIEAARKREERSARKKLKELQRRIKEQAKLTEQEQAQLEVEAFENEMELLLSIHKDASASFDWMEPLSALPPPKPSGADLSAYERECAEIGKMRQLAKRILAGEADAYGEALQEMSAFGELTMLGSSIEIHVHNPRRISCDLRVNGRDVIPKEVKSLTATGKLSVKAMPKARFHETYQDYVCGCVLRVARAVLALLPVETVIVTAKISTLQASTGTDVEIPVLSAAIPRTTLEQLDFSRLDPSDSMSNFKCRGDVTASRRSGEFTPIVPFEAADLVSADRSVDELIAEAKRLRADIAAKFNEHNKGTSRALATNPSES